MHPLYELPKHSKARIKAWRKLVRKHAQSNLKTATFCQEQDVNLKTFNKWKATFEKRKKKIKNKTEAKTFIPVAIKTTEAIETTSKMIYEISHRNGFSLKCNGDVNMEIVTRLLKAIRGVV